MFCLNVYGIASFVSFGRPLRRALRESHLRRATGNFPLLKNLFCAKVKIGIGMDSYFSYGNCETCKNPFKAPFCAWPFKKKKLCDDCFIEYKTIFDGTDFSRLEENYELDCYKEEGLNE